jgi:hypothetical protein
MPDRPSIVKEYKFWIGLIGALVAAGPLISLIQKLLDVGLTPVFANALSYYRGITYPLVDWLRYFISFIPPLDLYRFIFSWIISLDTYRDLTVLSFLVAGAMSRAIRTVNTQRQAGDEIHDEREEFLVEVGALILKVLFAYSLLPLFLLVFLFETWATAPEERPYINYFLLNFLLALVAAVAFFVANEVMK